MLERIKYATISDIYVKDLIFYNEQNIEELKHFCFVNGISYLPGENRTSIYKITNLGFEECSLEDHLICNPYDRIFEEKTLNKFKNGCSDEVMFVCEDGLIKGVVHVIDYNADFINVEFYKLCFHFEKMLRDLLIKQGETNESLIEWFKEKGRQNKHWQRRYFECMPEEQIELESQIKRRNDLNLFQTFYLNDLLYFVSSRRYVSPFFRKSLNSIARIRNWVAHSKDLIMMSDKLEKPIYRINKLEAFLEDSNVFFKCYEELEIG